LRHDQAIESLALSEREVNQLVAFLFTLTDVRRTTEPTLAAVPFRASFAALSARESHSSKVFLSMYSN
jgi:hypothetical protein